MDFVNESKKRTCKGEKCTLHFKKHVFTNGNTCWWCSYDNTCLKPKNKSKLEPGILKECIFFGVAQSI